MERCYIGLWSCAGVLVIQFKYIGKQPTNNRDIESQLMERFLRENASCYPEDFRDDFLSITESVSVNKVV